MHEGRGELGLFILEYRRLWGSHQMSRCQGESTGSLEVHCDRTRVDGHVIEHREFQLGT